MNLKKLEIHGFKSFAEKTQFTFSRGVTAVVGPNGSGKSNIADAIRWVLGEQSMKALRGGKAEDIIFSGATNRKPLGMAEVSLILNNEQQTLPIAFSDVKVTRRLYRSGETEYYINDAPCRLKDIYDLFADSGLGKDALAIVSQGKIDEILSVRPEDRRGIIEEAAGITRYRNRKKEAEKKLHDTERDIERITDIVLTLGERINPLAEQKDKAESYLILSSELKSLERQLLMQQYFDIETRKEKAIVKIEEISIDLFVKENAVHSLEAKLEQKRLELLKDEEKISTLQQQLLAITSEWEKMQGEKRLIDEKLSFVIQKIGDHENRINLQESKIKDLDGVEERISFSLKEKDNYEKQLLSKLREAEENKDSKIHEVQAREEELEQKKAQAFNDAQNLSEAKNALLQLKKEQELTGNKITSLTEKIAAFEQEIETHNTKLSEYRNRYSNYKEEIKVLTSREEDVKRQLQELQQAQTKVTAAVLEKNTAMEAHRKQHLFYTEMENKHEGYGHAVKALFEAKGKDKHSFSALHGTVADIISLDEKYEIAVETALGAAIQNIIVDSEEDAKNAITYLKNNHLGRATFLPLSVIRGERFKHSGNYLIASDIVSTHERYKNIIEFLLGKTLITKDMTSAIAAAKETSHRCKIVTLEGEIIFPGGSISGGSIPKKQTALLSRKRLIDELTKQIEELRLANLKLNKETEEICCSIKNKEEQFSEVNQGKNALLENSRMLETNIALLSQKLERLELDCNDKKTEFNFLTEDARKISLDINNFQSTVFEKEKIYSEAIKEIDKLTQTLQELKSKNLDEGNELLSIQTELARCQEEIKNKKAEEISVSKNIANSNAELTALEKAKEKLLIEKIENEQAKEALNATFLKCASKRTEVENIIESEKELKQQKQMSCFEDEQELKVLQKQLTALSDNVHNQQVRLAKLETEADTLHERFNTEQGAALADVQHELINDFNAKTAQENINSLQQEIQILGTVNLTAIEEFDEVIKRHAFLEEQKQDLSAAKDALFIVVTEIEKEMCSKFLETFAAVDNEFQKVFQQIFGGGTAKLSLTDAEKPLESGIDIIAQPPGKKLQHLMLLSGGEKALTAIALLFAVLHIKPAPFCVLDEIEAALDEVNVERFARFLKDFSDKTQFIVISHRQATMEVADTLYGTTMQESGVTKLISVKFDERMVV